MAASSHGTFSLEQLYKKVTTVLENKLSLFQGLTLTSISIDKKLAPHDTYPYSFYTGTTKSSNKNYTVQLKISNSIVMQHLKQSGDVQHNAMYDIEIDSLSVLRFGTLAITVKSIKETGVSERELLRRKLEKFTKKHGYDKRTKKELPRLVTSILALTSKFSDIYDDLHSNLNIDKERVAVVNCTNSHDISQQIKNNSGYDIVVLYRGGREDEAMNMFSSENIIESIASSKVPVCAALGHDMDTPFIYTIADKTYSTPSAFSKAITMHNLNACEEYEGTLKSIAATLTVLKDRMLTKYTKVFDTIEATSQRLYEKVNAKIDKLLKETQGSVTRIADRIYHRIITVEEKIESLVLRVHQTKIENIMATETAIGYYMNDVYKNRVNYIDALLEKVEHYGLRIEENIKSKEMLQTEREKKQKTLWIFIGITVVLLSVIIWLAILK